MMLKYSALRKKARTLSVSKAISFTDKGQGKLTYQITKAVKGKKSVRKKFAISEKTGKIIVKKGLKKGTYKVKIKVTAAGNDNYKSARQTAIVTIKVK